MPASTQVIKHVYFNQARSTIPYYVPDESEYDDYSLFEPEYMCRLPKEDWKKQYQASYKSFEDGLEHTYQSFLSNYVNTPRKDQIHLFITVNWQDKAFRRYMERADLWKYLVHETAWAGNKNYPERKVYHSLKAYLFHYKD